MKAFTQWLVGCALLSGLGAPELRGAFSACDACHPAIARSFRKTGMGRSFFPLSPATAIESWARQEVFYHEASGSYYRMEQRPDGYFQVRYQIGFGGRETNRDEKRIDYVMGSGTHARTYLHRTERGTLVELPLGWYSEEGGHWGMNPGYDHAHQPQARREIGYDCMFCHNATPRIPDGRANQPVYLDPLPEGIDCARCHGSGAAHVAAKGKHGTILNPASLTADRQMDLCYQCHLNPTSFRLPHAVKRYERSEFDYRPGEPLSAFLLYFDKAGKKDGRFEIAGSAYRLRQSPCFLESAGQLKCTTCHDPHGAPPQYDAACQTCHARTQRVHFTQTGCDGCHMPKRRTEDVVQAVMTDHRIQRVPEPGFLARRAELVETDANAYQGTVVPYYPDTIDEVYRAVAQVRDGANLPPGIAQLTAVLARLKPRLADPYFDLAEALRATHRYEQAASAYTEALARDQNFLAARLGLGASLKAAGKPLAALDAFRTAAKQNPEDARAWNQVGQSELDRGQPGGAQAAFEEALRHDAEMPEALNGLGVAQATSARFAAAETAFREAIRVQPDYAEAHANLGNLLSIAGRFTEAVDEFETAIRQDPDRSLTRAGYGAMLESMGNGAGARTQLEAAVRLDGHNAGFHEQLAKLYERLGLSGLAAGQSREAARLRAK